jgi:hypothetical protein
LAALQHQYANRRHGDAPACPLRARAPNVLHVEQAIANELLNVAARDGEILGHERGRHAALEGVAHGVGTFTMPALIAAARTDLKAPASSSASRSGASFRRRRSRYELVLPDKAVLA